jgi:uncharacterized membrane protein
LRYPSGKSIGFSLLIWGVVLLLVISLALAIVVSAPYTEIIIAGSILAIAFILWIWFGTYYEFKESFVLLRMGPFMEKVSYDKITSARIFKSMASSMALSSAMIELRHGKNYITGTTYISPEDRDGFLAELKVRCAGRNLSGET